MFFHDSVVAGRKNCRMTSIYDQLVAERGDPRFYVMLPISLAETMLVNPLARGGRIEGRAEALVALDNSYVIPRRHLEHFRLDVIKRLNDA
jgi:hypothetical protein